MVRGLNRQLIIGNLGGDPTLKYTQDGKPVCNFSVAVSRQWKGADGEIKEQTEWFRVIAWERLAETCNEYLHKGSKVFVSGRQQTREYTNEAGERQRITETVADEMIMLDGAPGNRAEAEPAPAVPRRTVPGLRQTMQADPEAADDIPF
jgi:single-strand DNA-binding protein